MKRQTDWRRPGSAVRGALWIIGAFGLGVLVGLTPQRAKEEETASVAKIRGVYDPQLAELCVRRGDTTVLVVDLMVEDGRTEFACAAAGSLQSLTERAVVP